MYVNIIFQRRCQEAIIGDFLVLEVGLQNGAGKMIYLRFCV
jgi:hypothetical protein